MNYDPYHVREDQLAMLAGHGDQRMREDQIIQSLPNQKKGLDILDTIPHNVKMDKRETHVIGVYHSMIAGFCYDAKDCPVCKLREWITKVVK
ncbi:hypothetical protein LCGC14_2620430 [marine sediment metagenome]|uniref:Uncharacterized protein n=1 Tax=marine sediment metagenome TaxID=412755 RepID=A0A0F9AQU1_9ZZZZ